MKKMKKLPVYHEVYEGTPEQRANMKKLADYLMRCRRPQKTFNMSRYYVDSTGRIIPGTKATDCNTVACAIGHGPFAGIPMSTEAKLSPFPWECYRDENFGSSSYLFVWCFAAPWQAYDNSRRGAALRIRYVLEYGIPIREAEQYGYLNEKSTADLYRMWTAELERII